MRIAEAVKAAIGFDAVDAADDGFDFAIDLKETWRPPTSERPRVAGVASEVGRYATRGPRIAQANTYAKESAGTAGRRPSRPRG